MAVVKTFAARPVASSSSSSQCRQRSRAGQASWPLFVLTSTRRFLFLCVVMGSTALIAFHRRLRPGRHDSLLHANPVRQGGANVRGDAAQPAPSSTSRLPSGATNLDGNRAMPRTQQSAAVEATSSHQRRQDVDASCKFRVRSVRDLQTCYPSSLVRRLDPGCDRITEWEDVQRCLNTQPNVKTDAPRIDHYDISLIGERNSGTKFLIQELQQCFRSLTSRDGASVGGTEREILLRHQVSGTLRINSTQPPTVKIHRDFHRHKHFFQPLYAGDKYRHRIVVALFRDPVEWVAAMRENPYHSPAHVAGYRRRRNHNGGDEEFRVVPLPWQEFVRRPWTTDRTPRDVDILRNATAIQQTLKGETCLYRYSVLDAVPCLFDNETQNYPSIPDPLLRGYVPLYELRRDRSQEPFENLLQLRAEKIVNFLVEIPLVYKHLGGYVAARYEDLLRQGTRPLLEHVASLMGLQGLPSDCVPAGPQPERLGRRTIPNEFRTWITDHMDPDLEHLLGYATAPLASGQERLRRK